MTQTLIMAVTPSFYEKQVIHTRLEVVFPVAREVFPLFGAYLGLISVKRAMEMQKLPPSKHPPDGRIKVVSILVGRPVRKPTWTSRVDENGMGRNFAEADAILLQRTAAPVSMPDEMQPGELMVVDPRVLVRQHDTGTVIYQPRSSIAERHGFEGWMGAWMHRNTGWPDDWIQHGTWPEERTSPTVPPLVKTTAPGQLMVFGDTMDRDGEVVQSAKRGVTGSIFMEGA